MGQRKEDEEEAFEVFLCPFLLLRPRLGRLFGHLAAPTKWQAGSPNQHKNVSCYMPEAKEVQQYLVFYGILEKIDQRIEKIAESIDRRRPYCSG